MKTISLWQRIQRRILSGLILIVPIVVTVFVAQLLYGFVKDFAGPLTGALFSIPPMGWLESHGYLPVGMIKVLVTVLLALSLLYVLGLISNTILIRKAYATGEGLLLRIPLLKSVYGTTKQITDLVTNRQKNTFKEVARFEYPRPGMYALGFVTGEIRYGDDPRLFVCVLMPTTPLPTQLFLMTVPAEQVQVVELSIEDGLKFIMSGGVVAPEYLEVRPYRPQSMRDGSAAAQLDPDASLG